LEGNIINIGSAILNIKDYLQNELIQFIKNESRTIQDYKRCKICINLIPLDSFSKGQNECKQCRSAQERYKKDPNSIMNLIQIPTVPYDCINYKGSLIKVSVPNEAQRLTIDEYNLLYTSLNMALDKIKYILSRLPLEIVYDQSSICDLQQSSLQRNGNAKDKGYFFIS